jgi:hypothetical protein
MVGYIGVIDLPAQRHYFHKVIIAHKGDAMLIEGAPVILVAILTHL